MSRGFLDEDVADDGDLGALDAREVEIVGRVVERKARALLFDSGDRKSHWVPISLIRGSEQSGLGVITLRVPEWWAKKEKLI